MTWGLGCLPDVRFAESTWKRQEFCALVQAGEAPEAFDAHLTIHRCINQGLTSACCGQGVARGIERRGVYLYGADFELPAPRFIYDGGRSLEGDPRLDVGTTIGACLEVVSAMGYPPLSACPWDEAAATDPEKYSSWINDPVDLDVLQASFDQLDVKWHFLGTDPDERELAVKRLAVWGVPVVIGQLVDQGYMANVGGVYRFTGPALGRHCTASDLAYDADGLWMIGSYGPGWAAGGRIKLSWDDLRDATKVPTIAAVDAVRRYSLRQSA